MKTALKSTVEVQGPLAADELRRLNAWWRACNYLAVGMIYLRDNPLLREPLDARSRQAPPAGPLGREPRAVVHLGAPQPGDQARRPRHDLRRGPRSRRARACWAPATSRAPTRRSIRTRARTWKACRSSSSSSRFPATSAATSRPRRPGSIHEGGELGYSLSHAYGMALRQSRSDRRLRGRRRRGGDRARSPPPGTRTSSSIRSATARCCRS